MSDIVISPNFLDQFIDRFDRGLIDGGHPVARRIVGLKAVSDADNRLTMQELRDAFRHVFKNYGQRQHSLYSAADQAFQGMLNKVDGEVNTMAEADALFSVLDDQGLFLLAGGAVVLDGLEKPDNFIGLLMHKGSADCVTLHQDIATHDDAQHMAFPVWTRSILTQSPNEFFHVFVGKWLFVFPTLNRVTFEPQDQTHCRAESKKVTNHDAVIEIAGTSGNEEKFGNYLDDFLDTSLYQNRIMFSHVVHRIDDDMYYYGSRAISGVGGSRDDAIRSAIVQSALRTRRQFNTKKGMGTVAIKVQPVTVDRDSEGYVLNYKPKGKAFWEEITPKRGVIF
ncbi:MAG: hypothetical protein HQM16_05455 [Deltaproteobacteria bacterium]|nr:hypothetical protein [Deltaproteobacteria bacterium]